MHSDNQELRNKGFKVTPQRSLILEIMRNSTSHDMSAEDIFTRAREVQPQISCGTVYRNLNTLCEIGLVERFNPLGEEWRYELNGSHHHHLICIECRRTMPLEFCPMSPELRDITEKIGFEVAGHHFEVRGYCEQCRKGEKV